MDTDVGWGPLWSPAPGTHPWPSLEAVRKAGRAKRGPGGVGARFIAPGGPHAQRSPALSWLRSPACFAGSQKNCQGERDPCGRPRPIHTRPPHAKKMSCIEGTPPGMKGFQRTTGETAQETGLFIGYLLIKIRHFNMQCPGYSFQGVEGRRIFFIVDNAGNGTEK